GVSAPQIFQNRSPNRGNHPAAKPRDRAIAVFTAQPTVTSCAISVPGLLYLVEQARAGLAEPADAETKRTLRCGQRCSPPPPGSSPQSMPRFASGTELLAGIADEPAERPCRGSGRSAMSNRVAAFACSLGFLASGLLSPAILAATPAASFAVTATVQAGCLISATSIPLKNHLATVDMAKHGVSVTCTMAISYAVFCLKKKKKVGVGGWGGVVGGRGGGGL